MPVITNAASPISDTLATLKFVNDMMTRNDNKSCCWSIYNCSKFCCTVTCTLTLVPILILVFIWIISKYFFASSGKI